MQTPTMNLFSNFWYMLNTPQKAFFFLRVREVHKIKLPVDHKLSNTLRLPLRKVMNVIFWGGGWGLTGTRSHIRSDCLGILAHR